MPAALAALAERWRTHPPVPVDGRLVVPAGARSIVVAGIALRADGPVLVVVPGEREAEELVDDLRLFTDRVFQMPAWETLPFEHVSPSVLTMAQRSQARHELRSAPAGTVVVASARAAGQRVADADPAPLVVADGTELDFESAAAWLADRGYHRTDRVESRGEFAVRGGILDVFPAQGRRPARLEFWGDSVDSARWFSASSQRSSDAAERVEIHPAREFRPTSLTRERASELLRTESWAASTWDRFVEGMHFAGMESWLPWLTEPATVLDEFDGALVVFDPVRVWSRLEDIRAEERDLAEALAPTWGSGAPEAGDHPDLYLELNLEGRQWLDAPPLAARPEDEALEVRRLDAPAGDAEKLATEISRHIAAGIDIVVAMDGEAAASRVRDRLGDAGLDLPRLHEKANASVIHHEGIHHGFILPALGVGVVGEQEIAGRRRSHRRSVRRAETATTYRDLTEGDYVVHHRHGIGRFDGLVTRTIAGVERDYLVVAYAGEDRLYVPTDQLAAVTRYTGGETPRLSRMGGADWSKTKDRVRRAAAVVAEHVVSLHRQRAAASGRSLPPDTPWQRELEASFPYEETPDQLTAIAAVKADMERSEPMDRLVFGDVGFGKTEVALRAAFKAATNGQQVVILCPTTLLAQQHFQTFTERYEPFPIKVAMLSRFLTAKQQREVVAGLAAGTVDVVIGTHRLLSGDVDMPNLGLVIVDEEQRFGVTAKDKLKQLDVAVDVLTLTATPIPRTLEMALTGVRQVSHIRTPPGDRHPILTYVGPYDEQSVAAAIRREMLREGQVFFVHNRVQSIERAVAHLRELVPHARFAVAHGQMNEGQLEQVMYDFWNREYDVLVATTIIESGLDLPQVNTLIVERADMLGLAQLYQLRGRVGRSDQRAYAYLFHPAEVTLSEEAFRRLEAVGEHTDLGSGFQLAQRDLEIRGAGSMLGEVQSGHIAAVGFDLYVQLVADAVGELEGTSLMSPSNAEVRLELPVDAHIPDSYMEDQLARLEAYRRLAAATTPGEVDDVATEWRDRYGPVPDDAATLLEIARLRVEAIRVGLGEIVNLRREVRIGPVDLTASQEVRLQRLQPRSALRPAEGLLFIPAPPADEVVADLIAFVHAMWPAESSVAAV